MDFYPDLKSLISEIEGLTLEIDSLVSKAELLSVTKSSLLNQLDSKTSAYTIKSQTEVVSVEICFKCEGSGITNTFKCPVCFGEKNVKVPRMAEANIPDPGLQHLVQRLREDRWRNRLYPEHHRLS